MVARSTGAVLLGIDARLVDVEVDLAGGLPAIAAVGLPDAAVREGVDRVRSAIRHAGYRLPQRRVVINLAPADVPKAGAALDLPIAAALLAADEQIPPLEPGQAVLVGELGLDGAVRPVRGVLSVALAAHRAGRTRLLAPRANASEAALVRELQVFAVGHLAEVARFAAGGLAAEPPHDPERLLGDGRRSATPDLAEVRGQAGARRALEVSAAGGHHLLMAGPPGSGKTMLARRLPGILPRMAVAEALEVTRVWSAAGLAAGLVVERPFRAPHHGISAAGMAGGGGRVPRPGELSLASHGVLYLDELPEFRRDALEALRQPLECGTILVRRVHGAFEFPARFALVASMNPCNCGFHGTPDGRCKCTPMEIRRYLSRLSGPLLDRFDVVVDVPPVDLHALTDAPTGESSAAVCERVDAARARQRRRFGSTGPSCNARMGPAELERFASLGAEQKRLLFRACELLRLSARGFDRVRRVARTLADLEGCDALDTGHVAEALQYRQSATLGRD